MSLPREYTAKYNAEENGITFKCIYRVYWQWRCIGTTTRFLLEIPVPSVYII